ncbi:MAG TPA: hypothetical protein HA222_02805 [Candidatus Diapherotrites archaeon]|uniref:Uncharacterized protein n=1 Tax=Candidatus Iainarchaeum sp. TaxID=3101447 RepID=A0A7J4KX88_9ARCH|nr:hypothetical protein [Candidatus Diapherotrites archaeon]HIH33045.1 hypothetical protein [Candidatus Diapherotrites archaeon]
MDTKGQFSLDLIVAVLVFLVAVQIILSMTSGFEASQSKIATQNQLRDIAELTASKLSQLSILSAKGSQLSFEIPLLLVAGKPAQDCKVKVQTRWVNASFKEGVPEQESVSVDFVNNINFNAASIFDCGKKVACTASVKSPGTPNEKIVWTCVNV